MNETFPINSNTARKVWDNFDRELMHKLKILPEHERRDIRLEILSHLYESANSSDKNQSEEVKLINAIEKLGTPEEYLEPLISDILLYQKTVKGYPIAVLRGLIQSAQKGLLHALATIVLGMGYFWVITIFIMSVMHIGNPDVGIWLHSSGSISLSFGAQPDAIQWMTGWFSLIGILTSSFAYWLLSKLLGLIIAKTNVLN